MRFDREREIARLERERADLDAVLRYLRSLPNDETSQSGKEPAQSKGARAVGGAKATKREFGAPRFGPGLKTLIVNFVRENGPVEVGRIVEGVRAQFPDAKESSIRSDVQRAKTLGELQRTEAGWAAVSIPETDRGATL
jgi:hypothetical protein